jgi:hypothetical protein
MKNDRLLVVAILFLILAISNATTVFSDVSLASKIGFFVFGFGSGITFGLWWAERFPRSEK